MVFGQEKNEKTEGYAWLFAVLVLVNVFWGASSVAVKIALGEMETVEIIALRFLIAAPILVAVTVAWKGWGSLAVAKKDLPYLLLLSIVGVPAEFFLQVWSLERTTAINFNLIYNLSTFFIIFLSAAFAGERLLKNKLAGAVIGFAGAGLVTMAGGPEGFSLSAGDLIALAGTAVWALYTVMGQALNSRYSALTVLNYVFVLGAIELIPAYLLTPHTALATLSTGTWLAMAFLTLGSGILAFFLYNYALEKLPASTVGMFMYISPVSGVLLAALLLGEQLNAITAIGAVLTLGGVYLAERKGRRSSAEEERSKIVQ